MSVNNLSFEQAASILNEIHREVTGQSNNVAILSTNDFVSVGQKVLKTGLDPVMQAVSQLVGRTIFSARPYARKFVNLYADAQRFGYITRKLAVADKDWANDVSFELVDGQTYTDQYKVKLPNVLQLNFYGQNVFMDWYTVLRNQLNSAFDSPASLGSFLGMIVQNMQDRIEQNREAYARATLVNFIAGKVSQTSGVFNLRTLYWEYLGNSGAVPDTFPYADAAQFERFNKWAFAEIQTVSDMMEERTQLFQINVTGKTIMHHTPKSKQRLLMNSEFLNQMKAQVNSGAFHDSFLDYTNAEAVTYWQNPVAPTSISATPAVLMASGEIGTASEQTLDGIVGLLFDMDALGITSMDEYTDTAKEAAGGYTNIFFHFITRWWNDFTEKGVIFTLN